MGHRTFRSGQRGVTRLELAIVATLVSLVGVGIWAVIEPTAEAERTEEALRDAERIRIAAQRWQRTNAEQKGCPTISQLVHEEQLDPKVRTDDPWGERFRVYCRGTDVVVSSAGRDGQSNTDDDVRAPRS
jgi:general secretion pathway protein G